MPNIYRQREASVNQASASASASPTAPPPQDARSSGIVPSGYIVKNGVVYVPLETPATPASAAPATPATPNAAADGAAADWGATYAGTDATYAGTDATYAGKDAHLIDALRRIAGDMHAAEVLLY